jgi:hypothetical protein
MESQTLTRQPQIEIASPHEDSAGDYAVLGATTLDIPSHIQTSLDAILDYYADNALIPEIKLCGNPLDIASEFVIKIHETVPAHLTNASKDILDFMIREMAEFCKMRSLNYLTLRFSFNRSYRSEAA